MTGWRQVVRAGHRLPWRVLGADDGQTLVEYALILAIVAAGCIGVLSILSSQISGLIERVAAAFP